MIQPACLKREKCSLRAFSVGLSSFFWLSEPLESLTEACTNWLGLGAIEFDLLAACVEFAKSDEDPCDSFLLTTAVSVPFACEFKGPLTREKGFDFLSSWFNKDALDPTFLRPPVVVSFRSKWSGFRDWKKGKLFGFLSISKHCLITSLDPCRARSVCCCVIFSKGASSLFESSSSVSMYFMCSLFCRNSASSRNFSSLILASEYWKEENKLILSVTMRPGNKMHFTKTETIDWHAWQYYLSTWYYHRNTAELLPRNTTTTFLGGFHVASMKSTKLWF